MLYRAIAPVGRSSAYPRSAPSGNAAPIPVPAAARALARPRPTPGHAAARAETSRRFSSCRPRAAERDLRHRHRRHALLRRSGAELGRRGHEILATDQRPLGMDRAAFVLEERAGHAEREVGRRQFAVGLAGALAISPRGAIAASAAAKRAESAWRRSAGIASTSCSSRSPSVRDTGTSWRQQAPQPLRQEMAWPASAASTTAFTRPCKRGHDLGGCHGRVRHGDRMGDPQRAHGEAQSGRGVAGIGHKPYIPCSGLARHTHATRPAWQSVSDIRRTFLEYFRSNGHEVVASSPLVPRNDPTLMFTNAGMVQFKNVFTGLETARPIRARRPRRNACAPAASTTTSRMWATPRATTPSSRCWATSRSATTSRNTRSSSRGTCSSRNSACPRTSCWSRCSTPTTRRRDTGRRSRAFPTTGSSASPTSDNFWAMGETGPCGPCSEIFFDHGEGIPGGPPGSADQDGDRFIEIWNLVFMQFEQQTPDLRVPLPKPSIDTGMGLERIAAVLQGKHNNYDIDLFRALIEAVAHETGVDPDGAAERVAQGDRRPFAHYVVPDRRRRAAVERGSRLRAAPHHAPRHAARPHPGGAGADDLQARARAGARDGRCLSRAGARPAADHRDAEARRGSLQEDPGHRAAAARRRDARPLGRRHAQGRCRLQALRHVRLSPRPDAGRAARA